MTKRLILYDLDGTLVDTQEDIAQAVNHALRALGRSPLARDRVRRAVGHGLHELMGQCLDTTDPRRIEEGIARFRVYYAEHLTDHSRLYPHVKELLEYFRDRTQVVLTNKPNPFAGDVLRALGVEGYFADIIAADDGFPNKPDPAAVTAMQQKIGATAAQTLLIGDSEIDLEVGRRAGIQTAIVAQGFVDRRELLALAPEIMVENLRELITLAQSRGW